LDLPSGQDWDDLVGKVMLEETPLHAGERTILSFTLPPEFLILFEPVSHTTHFLDVKGERTQQRQELTVTYAQTFGGHGSHELKPGPLRSRWRIAPTDGCCPACFAPTITCTT
jgi:hypothetical protein